MSLRDHKYLRTKSYNPTNIRNVKKVWEAEQAAATSRARADARREQLRAEREADELARAAGQRHGALRFMYEPPPTGAPPPPPPADADAGDDDDDGRARRRPKRPETARELEAAHGLAPAPLAGEYARERQVTLQPFGRELRRARCVRCGALGHQVRAQGAAWMRPVDG